MNQKRAKEFRRMAILLCAHRAPTYERIETPAPSIRKMVWGPVATNPDGAPILGRRAVLRSPHSDHHRMQLSPTCARAVYQDIKKTYPKHQSV